MILIKIIFINIMLFFIGYLFGQFIPAISIVKKLYYQDIRKLGSKNAGATNVARIFGNKIAIVVFFLDVFKIIIAILFTFILKKYLFDNDDSIYVAITGIGVIVGHIFPFWYDFKGGKGAACLVGYTIALEWPLFFVGFIAFFIILLFTKKVSVSSIIGSLLTWVVEIVLNITFKGQRLLFMPLITNNVWWSNILFFTFTISLIIFAHRDNIMRIIKGKEVTISIGKK